MSVPKLKATRVHARKKKLWVYNYDAQDPTQEYMVGNQQSLHPCFFLCTA